MGCVAQSRQEHQGPTVPAPVQNFDSRIGSDLHHPGSVRRRILPWSGDIAVAGFGAARSDIRPQNQQSVDEPPRSGTCSRHHLPIATYNAKPASVCVVLDLHGQLDGLRAHTDLQDSPKPCAGEPATLALVTSVRPPADHGRKPIDVSTPPAGPPPDRYRPRRP